MRNYLIAGNWKMYKTIKEAKELAQKIKNNLADIDIDVAICPPFTALAAVYEIIKDSNIKLGAQNIWYEEEGAYTGEISPKFITDIGCKYVIIGHSERREYFNESDALINKKIKAAIKFNLIPIVCIGEKIEEREANKTYEIIEKQFNGAFLEIDISKTIIAYEPVWAIGTGMTATPEIAEEAHKFIRKLAKEKYNEKIANNLLILYGGSVKPNNIEGLIKEEDIDGALVGGASISANEFIEIVKKANGKRY